MADSLAEKICNGIQRWYEFNECGDEYEALFSNMCDESMSNISRCSTCIDVHTLSSNFATPDGFDTDAINDELQVKDLNANQLLEFIEDLDDFPYGEDTADDPETEEGRKQFIFNLIVQITKNTNIDFKAMGCIPNCMHSVIDSEYCTPSKSVSLIDSFY